MIVVLRLGHRISRDKRVSTHCALVARAFGAHQIIFSGEKDARLVQTVNSVSKRWGGFFSARFEANWRRVLKGFDGIKAHLTMYGIPFEKKIKAIKKQLAEKRDLVIVIGSEKVPAEVYKTVDYNLSVTRQPQSEVGALAVFLYELTKVKENNFVGAQIKIIPQKHGKRIAVVEAR